MISLMTVEILVTLDKKTNLKDRRAVAQKLRDRIKTDFNVSAKIDYLEHRSQFRLMIAMLGESEDYLEEELDKMAEWIERVIGEEPRMAYQIEGWGL